MKNKANSGWIVAGAVFHKKHSRSNSTWIIEDVKSILVYARTNDSQSRLVRFLKIELEHLYEPVEPKEEDPPEDGEPEE